MAERDVPQDDRPAEQPDHQEPGADHQVRAKRQRPPHGAGSSRQ